jgi:hypothetical protein
LVPAGKYIAALLLLLLASAPAAQPAAVPWREAPEYVRLFAARGDRSAAYRAYVTTLDLDAVRQRIGVQWEARALLPLDAFGQTGAYDRWALLRLYGAQRPRVARGPKAMDGRVAESWTLISPYPDTTLQRLEEGTLVLVLRMP